MENKPRNVISENNSKDEIFIACEKNNGIAIDKNGFAWNKVDFIDTMKENKPTVSHYYTYVRVEKKENDNCYNLYYVGADPCCNNLASSIKSGHATKEDKEEYTGLTGDLGGSLLGKIDFDWLDDKEKQQMDKLAKLENIRLVAASADYAFNSHMLGSAYHKRTVKYKYCLFLFVLNYKVIPLMYGLEFDIGRSGVLEHTPLLDRLYLRMFFPEIYECEKRVDEKNDSIEQSFYSKRKKILLGESLSYITLLALSVVAMVFSLINLMIFIIAAAILTVIFGFGLLYEFKFRKLPYIDKLPQEEINEIEKQIEREKNKNKDKNQNKDKDNKKEEDENLMEINTDSHKKDEESLI